tara:strand:- start:2971 stop:3618 length:648 start_codon:yes stop_codon:yes gene_type:complete
MKLSKKYRICLLLATIYLILTLTEALVHKYVMHNEDGSWMRSFYGDGHMRHHTMVLNDMKLNDDDTDNHIGMFFSEKTVLQMTPLYTVVWPFVFKMFGFSISWRNSYALSLCISLFYKFLWDWLHYSFHQIKDLDRWKTNPVFYWLFRNHSYHHLVKGKQKGNYNIIFPGGDFILGTYRGCIDNTEYCKDNEHSICSIQEKKEVLEHGFQFCGAQ